MTAWSASTGRPTAPDHADAELLTTVGDAFGSLFASLTVAELEQLATEEQVLVAPILDAPAITASASLRSRQFFDDRTGAAAVPRSFGAARTRGGPWRWLGASLVRESDRPLNAPTPQGPPGGGPWRGTRLVEFGSGVAGPLVGRYFAEQGATVIRVESTARPDFLRLYTLGPDNPHGLEGSALFSWTNPGKLGVTLDLKSEAARELALGLVAQAHGVIENFTPGVLERLGLGYDDLCGVRADVVLLSMSFHGQSGPRRAESGFGALGSALSGFNHLTGWADGEPVGPASTITDSLAPRFGAAALGAALVRQRHGGRGPLGSGAARNGHLFAQPLAHLVRRRPGVGREGNACPGAVPHGLYPCVGDDRLGGRRGMDRRRMAGAPNRAGMGRAPAPLARRPSPRRRGRRPSHRILDLDLDGRRGR